MLVSKKKGPKRAGKSIPVKVDHYEERDGELGVVGTNLVNGETVFVTLTNKGEMASHKRRPTLEKFRDHNLIPRQNVGVDKGGVILFRYTYQIDDDHLVSAWPEFMTQNEEQEKHIRVGVPATVRVFERDDGTIFGEAAFWRPSEIESASKENVGEVIKDLVDTLHERMAGRGRAQVIIRGVNADGQVTSYATYSARYDSDAKRYMTGEELVGQFSEMSSYKAVMDDKQADFIEVLPAAAMSISNERANANPGKVRAWARGYTDKHGLMLYARDSVYRADETLTWIQQVAPIDPGAEGISPVQLGKDGTRDLSPDLAAAEEKAYNEAVAEVEKAPGDAAPSEKDELNPFAEEPAL